MASYRQRNGKWQARVLHDGYPDQTRTFATKADTEKWARSVESEIDRGVFANVSEAQRTSVGKVIKRNNIFSRSAAKFVAFGAMRLQSAQNSNAWHPLSKAKPSAALTGANRLDRKQRRERLGVLKLRPFTEERPDKAGLSEAKR